MLSATLRRFFRGVFSNRPATSHRSIRERLRPAFRPQVESLEDRTTPAVVNFNSTLGSITFTADAGESDIVTGSTPSQDLIQVQVGNGDSIILTGDAVLNPAFVLSTTVDPDDTLTIDTNGLVINSISVNLGDSSDSLTVTSLVIPDPGDAIVVTFDGQAGTDSIVFNQFALDGTLSAFAESISIVGAVFVNGDIALASTASPLFIGDALEAAGGNADIRLTIGAGIQQTAIGTIFADELGIAGAGDVLLDNTDSFVNTLAVNTMSLIRFRNSGNTLTNTLTIGNVVSFGGVFGGASGLSSNGDNIDVRTGANLMIQQNVTAGAGDIRLDSGMNGNLMQSAGAITGANLTLNSGAGQTINGNINVGAGTVTSNASLTTPSTVTVNTQITAGMVVFNGSNVEGPDGVSTRFFITPSANAPIRINSVNPADPNVEFTPINLGGVVGTQVQTMVTTNGNQDSVSGRITFANRRTITLNQVLALVRDGLASLAVAAESKIVSVGANPVAGSTPFGGFTGQIRTAIGDINGDLRADSIVVPGPGGGPHVKVIDGATGAEIRSFFAYGSGFQGGLFVAAGDVTGDGIDDIITSVGPGAGPHVKVFDGRTGAEVFSFFAYVSTFTGGVTVAAGDVDNDGRADIITAVFSQAGPHVKVFSGRNLAELMSFFAYVPTFSGGVFVAAGDTNGDGRADIITGTASIAGPHVRVFSGNGGAELASFFAYTPGFQGGVRVGTVDFDGDGIADIVTGAGVGAGPHVRVFRGTNLGELFSQFVGDPARTDGVFIGGDRG